VAGPPGGGASGGAPAGCPSTYVDAELLLTGLPQGYFDFFSNRNALLRSFCDNLAATSRPSDFCDNCVRIVSAITLTERRRAVVDSGGMQVQVVVRVHTEVQDAPEVQAANLDTIVRSGLVDQPTVVVAASWGDPQGAVAVAPMETTTTVGPSTTTTVEAAVSAATKRKILILIVVFAMILLLLFVLLFVFLRRRAVLQERLCEHQALQNRKGTISDPAPLLITHVMHVPSMGFMDASSYSGSHSESGRSVGSGNHKYQKPAWMMKFEDPVCMYPLDMLAFSAVTKEMLHACISMHTCNVAARHGSVWFADLRAPTHNTCMLPHHTTSVVSRGSSADCQRQLMPRCCEWWATRG